MAFMTDFVNGAGIPLLSESLSVVPSRRMLAQPYFQQAAETIDYEPICSSPTKSSIEKRIHFSELLLALCA